MRDWHLTASDPLTMRFAADARLAHTDYVDDQSWEIAFGGRQEPALSFQSRYGGRAGLARIVPMWVFDGKPLYEGGFFAEQPALRAFAPNYARISARLTKTLNLTAELWVMDSHSVGGRFTMENMGNAAQSLQLEVFAQIVREGEVVEMNLLSLENSGEALHLGEVGNLNPVLMLERAVPTIAAQGEHVSPKLSAPLTIAAGEKIAVRWVHSGRPLLNDSLTTAYRWLYQTDWDAAIAQIAQTNASTPEIETGNADWDAAIVLGNQVTLRSFLSPTDQLPFASFVSARIPSRGFSAHADGSDHGWQWSGQAATLGYLLLPAVAHLAPDLARGALRNWLATARSGGWIDFKPGLGGQRSTLLSLPILAATAWRIYEITEDKAFITEVFPGLLEFFERWFQPDMDKDRDGLPEWTSVTQNGYPDNPTFARYRRWAQNADINKAEAPDLAAYLLNEAQSLLNMTDVLDRQDATAAIKARQDVLVKQLDSLWSESAGAYLYRDRDTHLVPVGKRLFQGKGLDAFDSGARLDPPNRLILRVIGGKDHAPRVSVAIEGIDAKGAHVAETVPTSAFVWHYGMGSAVSDHAYSQINYARFEGLSRVYTTEIDTVDLTRTNQTLLLPLWALHPDPTNESALVQAITDPARYWRPFGLPVCPANDPAFAANNDGGSGGVWMLWNVLILEGLLQANRTAEASMLFSRLMDAQIRALRRDRAFREAYNSETGDGLGDLDEVGGIMPLSFIMQMCGIRIISKRRVWAGGVVVLPNPVKVTQFGVEVTRSGNGTTVRFPSGHTANVGPEWQLIEDPTPEPPAPEPIPATIPVAPATPEPAAETAGSPSIIPIDRRKTETIEIPVSRIDFGAQPEEPPRTPDRPAGSGPERSGAVKIPVKGPDDEE